MEWQYRLGDIPGIADRIWREAGNRKVIAFHGDLGAGKTTLIHALCDAKKVSGTVSSPTFSIINEYAYPGGTLYHIDLYRLQDEGEAIRAGVEDCLYSGHINLVEWPERAPGLFPEDTLHVFLETRDAQTRRLHIGEN